MTARTRAIELLAVAGGILGTAAGVVELSLGPHMRSWVGGKYDTTRLGVVTILLGLIALGGVLALRRATAARVGAAMVATAAFGVPGLLGFTTAGRLWYLPGALLLAGSILLAAGLRHEGAAVRHTVARHGLATLVAILGALDVVLGATALGLAGILGVAGGLGVIAVAAASGRLRRRTTEALLVVAAVPFGVLTWWSVVTPLIALLVLALGAGLAARKPGAPLAGHSPALVAGAYAITIIEDATGV